MRLIELSANQDSFRTVRFNRSGLTLIVGTKTDPSDKSRHHSTNGVGKSLLIYLISFCLGSDSNRQLKEKLPDWEFTLTFEHKHTLRTVARSTNNQGYLMVDGQKTALRAFNKAMGLEFFGIIESTKELTFRLLMRLFLRQGKSAYISEAVTFANEKQFQSQLRGSYLFGLDENFPLRKLELRQEWDKVESIRLQLQKDSFLRDYFQGNRDASLELADLDDHIVSLKKKVSKFKIAENYDLMAGEAEAARRDWQRSRNELNSLESSLLQIEASLSVQPEITTDTIQGMYRDAKIELPGAVLKKITEVLEFHRELVESRTRRLVLEKHEIERRRDTLKQELQTLSQKKDDYYRFLGSHGALREYEAIHSNLMESQLKADRLRQFKKLQEECTERAQKNKLEMSQENIRTTEYLKAVKPITDEINDRFRSMARRIWPNHTCGLVINNNEGSNQIRFDIDAKIQGDASDGVGETKLFCFDMTILLGQRNHLMRFVAHDNRLYPGIDPRQCVELFRIADGLTRDHDMQYIASVSKADLVAMREVMEAPQEYDSLFSNNIVLELTDDSDKGKLLGVFVDVEYE